MGALHAGHLGLVQRARAENDRVCVSVFVNPLQFDDPGDFERYPRDLEADARLLEEAGCDALFSGRLEQFFPEARGPSSIALLDPGPAARGLEGDHRPGHFAGVATICARLFEIVAPARAYFGEKDYQQCLVVSHLAARRGGPRIVVCPTSRDPDGLARSSRNALLDPAGRARALAIPRALFAARAAWGEGLRDVGRLEALLLEELRRAELEVEYARVRSPARLDQAPPDGRAADDARALIAARVGRVRLIDNLAPAPDAEPA